jgi:CDGSH-type Zn-finger protein
MPVWKRIPIRELPQQKIMSRCPEQYWVPELLQTSGLKISHGLCPRCATALYPWNSFEEHEGRAECSFTIPRSPNTMDERRYAPRTSGGYMAQVKITVRENGPLRIEAPEGTIELVDADGKAYDLTGKPAFSLCRCGGSTNKPFCDGTHSRIGFQGAEKAVAEAEKQGPQP